MTGQRGRGLTCSTELLVGIEPTATAGGLTHIQTTVLSAPQWNDVKVFILLHTFHT